MAPVLRSPGLLNCISISPLFLGLIDPGLLFSEQLQAKINTEIDACEPAVSPVFLLYFSFQLQYLTHNRFVFDIELHKSYKPYYVLNVVKKKPVNFETGSYMESAFYIVNYRHSEKLTGCSSL